jgi:hypothetical protein
MTMVARLTHPAGGPVADPPKVSTMDSRLAARDAIRARTPARRAYPGVVGNPARVEVAMGMFDTRADCLRALRPNLRFTVEDPPGWNPVWTQMSYTVREIWPSTDDDTAVVVDTWELQGDPITFPFSNVVSVG